MRKVFFGPAWHVIWGPATCFDSGLNLSTPPIIGLVAV
jgi:hypothetical protein